MIDIKENHIIPEKKIFDTFNLFEAIDAENYELALSLYNSDEKRKKEDKNPMYLLLCKVTDEIQKNIKFKTYMKEKIDVNPIENIVTITNYNIFDDMMGYLKRQDFHGCFGVLRSYLVHINKEEYEFLIVNLIQIDFLQNDIYFTRAFNALNDLQQDTFDLDISGYVRDFHIFISQENYEEAKLYLDIISKMKDLVQSEFLVEVLEYTLRSLSTKLNNRKNNTTTITEELSVPENITEKENQNTIDSQKVEVDDDILLINKKLDEVYKNGIVLLEPMSSERIKGIHSIVKSISDVVSFSIISDNERRVVLRYNPCYDYYVDIKKLLIDGNHAYKRGDFVGCIESYRKVLSFGFPKTYVYARLGLAYMRIGKISLAIDYLTVATELSKREDNYYDFTELIAKLSGKMYKPSVKMNVKEFINDMHDYYDVPNAEQILDLVKSGVRIEEACHMYDLTDEDISIVYLILAKKCYAKEMYISGDSYCKVVEKLPNKTDFVKSLLNEVRRNKKFYKNRVEVFQKQYKIN